MRLLNTRTLEMKVFSDVPGLPYAILSHTWSDNEEISSDDMLFLNSYQRRGFTRRLRFVATEDEIRYGSLVQKSGYAKIKRCCEIAAADGFEYAWVDTCCIDKSSSAELSEAINSMYRWYKLADVCYVYLADFELGSCSILEQFKIVAQPQSRFRLSRWFTRGWTLQELIAPASVMFFDVHWQQLGTKFALRKTISEVTRIHEEMLLDGSLKDYSVAQKMSWAASRNTTRVEDTAYSLMGLFDVNMPMLYGEGSKAFRRLQEEIIRRTDDHSILAWKQYQFSLGTGVTAVLADSPAAFATSGNVIRSPRLIPMSIKLSNRGVKLQVATPDTYDTLQVSPWQPNFVPQRDLLEEDSCLAILNCQQTNSPDLLLALRLGDPNSSSTHAERAGKTPEECTWSRFQDRTGPWTFVPKNQNKFNEILLREAYAVAWIEGGISLNYQRVFIEMLPRNDVDVSLLQAFPGPQGGTFEEGIATHIRFSVFKRLAVLRFALSRKSTFVLTIRQAGQLLNVNIVDPSASQKSLQAIFDLMHEHTSSDNECSDGAERYPEVFSEPVDQLVWQHPDIPLLVISIAAKRRVVSGERRSVVEIQTTRQDDIEILETNQQATESGKKPQKIQQTHE